MKGNVMKCPFRMITSKSGPAQYEYFSDCIFEECPYYSTEIKSKCYKAEATCVEVKEKYKNINNNQPS